MNWYIAAVKGHVKYFLAGPFTTDHEAAKNMTNVDGVRLSDCPLEFVRPRNYDYKVAQFYICKDVDNVQTWLGNFIKPQTQKGLF